MAVAAVVLVAGGAITVLGMRGQPVVVATPAPEQSSIVDAPSAATGLTGVIGTGEFVSGDGTAIGRVEIEANGPTADFSLTDLNLGGTYENVSPRLILGSSVGNRCADGVAFAFAFGDFTGTSNTFTAPADWVSGDWTAVAQVLITTAGMPDDNDGCSNRILARATIAWAIGSPLAYLSDVADRGTASGARGDVVTESNGRRVYVVAANDQIDDVAARFGLTRDELFALNPGRIPSPRDEMLYIDEKLNLDLAFR